jgi:hypothetical protein
MKHIIRINFILFITFIAMTNFRPSASVGPVAPAASARTLACKMNNASVKIEGSERQDVVLVTGGSRVAITENVTTLPNAAVIVSRDGDRITIKKTDTLHREYEILIPAGLGVDYTDSSVENGDIWISGVNKAVRVNTMLAKISLKDLGGPVYAAAAAQDIDMEFTHRTPSGNIELHSPGQSVTITAPADFSAMFQLEVMSGEVTSGFKLPSAVSSRDLKGEGNVRNLKFSLNGGTTVVKVSAHSIVLTPHATKS